MTKIARPIRDRPGYPYLVFKTINVYLIVGKDLIVYKLI